VVALVLGVVGCGSGGGTSSSSSRTSGTGAGASATGTVASGPGPAVCRSVAQPPPKGPQHLSPPNRDLDPHRTYTVTVVTNCGTFAFTLAVRQSPKTAASMDYLVKRDFFNGLTFHRVVAGFVIQGGDPLGNGSGGPGYTVVEPPPQSTQYVRGDVAMAKTQTDPRGASGSRLGVSGAAGSRR
jgi:peptidyl-prolyl cis-trans isomerase B (cyclophilin B)